MRSPMDGFEPLYGFWVSNPGPFKIKQEQQYSLNLKQKLQTSQDEKNWYVWVVTAGMEDSTLADCGVEKFSQAGTKSCCAI